MEKVRINFIVADYYDYVGTNPYYSRKERMLFSIPEQFKKNGYNIKFKTIYNKSFHWFKYYRVHMSLRMSEETLREILLKDEKYYGNIISNVSYKIIKKCQKEEVIC